MKATEHNRFPGGRWSLSGPPETLQRWSDLPLKATPAVHAVRPVCNTLLDDEGDDLDDADTVLRLRLWLIFDNQRRGVYDGSLGVL